MKLDSILSDFSETKPIIGMIHCKGTDDEDVLARAKREIDLYVQNGIDGIMVETYFGTYHQAASVLEYLKASKPPIPYGVNILNVDGACFEAAREYDCSFIQLDSVIGHVAPRDEESLAAFLAKERSTCKAHVMGGVRFKYQPLLSERSLEEDLVTAMGRCDAICVTGDATGHETSIEKIRRFRECIGDFPLFVCAGVTPENVREQLELCDGAVVGSYFKDTYKDSGDVDPEHVRKLMDAVWELRRDGGDGR
jgi:predicted TIM-barrel enzyme